MLIELIEMLFQAFSGTVVSASKSAVRQRRVVSKLPVGSLVPLVLSAGSNADF